MTRRSKREIERALEDVAPKSGSSPVTVAWRNSWTDELVDQDGDPIELDPDTDQLIVITRTVVISRERAEQEDREILWPAEDAPQPDLVKVAPRDLR